VEEYLRKVNAIVAASDPIADATLDARKGRVAPLMSVWGYWDTPEMPGLKCEASDAARAGKYLWGFGDYFREAEWDLLFALGQYASAYNLELHKNGLIKNLRCASAVEHRDT
jgi:hypothetical protein